MDNDPCIRIDWLGGNCPVQAEGTIGGKPFYFRARGKHWSFAVGADPLGSPEWRICRRYSWRQYMAGWMPQYTALACIAKAARLYANRKADA